MSKVSFTETPVKQLVVSAGDLVFIESVTGDQNFLLVSRISSGDSVLIDISTGIQWTGVDGEVDFISEGVSIQELENAFGASGIDSVKLFKSGKVEIAIQTERQ